MNSTEGSTEVEENGKVCGNDQKVNAFRYLSGKRLNRTILIAVASIITIIGIVAYVLLNTPEAKVARAFSKTYSTMLSEQMDIVEKLPVYDFFEDFASGAEYQISAELLDYYGEDYSYEGGIDYDAGKASHKLTYMGYDVGAKISRDYITFETDLLSDVYGINLKTLKDDLENFSLAPTKIEADLNIDPFPKLNLKVLESINKTFEKNIFTLIKNCEVEESSRDNTYTISISETDLEKYLLDCIDDIFEDKHVLAAYEESMEQFEIIEEITGEQLDIDLDDIKEIYEELAEELANFYGEYIDKIEVELLKGKIKKLTFEIMGEEIYIELNAEGNLLEEITIGTAYSDVVLSQSFEDGVYRASMIEATSNEVFTVMYKTESSRNNLILLSAFGETVSYTIDTTEKNTLKTNFEIEYSDYSYGYNYGYYNNYSDNTKTATMDIKILKNSASKNWFSQSSDFKNILHLKESDLYTIEYQLENMF